MRGFRTAGPAVVAVLALTFGAGCAGDSEPTGAAASSASSAPTSAASSAAGGSQNCDAVKAVHVEYSDKAIAALQKGTAATSEADVAAALADARKLATEWAGKLEPLAAQATDADLKTALTTFVGQLRQYGSGAVNVAQIQTALPAVTTALGKACP